MPEETKQDNMAKQASEVSQKGTGSEPVMVKKRNKKLIGGIIAAAAAVVVIGGAAFGYVMYQNPEKMVADAFANAVKSESIVFSGVVTGTQDSAPQNINVTFDGKGAGNRAETNVELDVEGDDMRVAANGSVVFAGDDGLFAKVANIRETLETAFQDAEGSEEMVDMIVERLDDKWIKLDADSDEGMTREYEEQRKCVNDIMKSFTESKDQQKQLADVYKNNRIFNVEKTGAEAIDGVNSHRFEVAIDESKLKDFANALKETDAAKALNDCVDEDMFADVDEALDEVAQESTDDNTKVEIWVSTWSHELTQLQVSGSSDSSEGNVTIKTKFNEEVNVETPADAEPIQDVMQDLMGVFFSYAMQQQGAPAGYEVDQDLMLDLNVR